MAQNAGVGPEEDGLTEGGLSVLPNGYQLVCAILHQNSENRMV
jgi:hypothetical protein